MHSFDPQAYGPVFAPLLDVDRRRPLDMGTPNAADHSALARLSVKAAFAHGPAVTDRNMAECCLAGVWLLHDFLDESHAISQRIDTPTGSFWHGIMHRREGDFSNAKYWFRRVGDHPVYERLGAAAAQISGVMGGETASKRLTNNGVLDPYAFVDRCQAARQDASLQGYCREMQQVEWELLFDFCHRQAAK